MLGDRNTKRALIGWGVFSLVMLLLPLVASTGTIRVFIFAQFLAIFAISWDIMSGRTGYISFGHPFLIGIGGYTTAILTYHLDWPIAITIPLAVIATMVGGTLFFLPALRTRGTYFALVTLAFMELMYGLVQVIAPKVTGGTRGLSGIPSIVTGAIPNYYLSLVVMLILAISLWLLVRTRLGALGGVFLATYTQLDPGMWVGPLIIAVAVLIVGGIGSIVGSMIAAQSAQSAGNGPGHHVHLVGADTGDHGALGIHGYGANGSSHMGLADEQQQTTQYNPAGDRGDDDVIGHTDALHPQHTRDQRPHALRRG